MRTLKNVHSQASQRKVIREKELPRGSLMCTMPKSEKEFLVRLALAEVEAQQD